MRCGCLLFFFFQAEDGIRDGTVTGVQTCALPISVLDVRARLANVEYCGGDLADAAAVERAVRGAAVVIHAGAATRGGWPERSEERRVGKEWRSRGSPER